MRSLVKKSCNSPANSTPGRTSAVSPGAAASAKAGRTGRSSPNYGKVQLALAFSVGQSRLTRQLEAFEDPSPDFLRVVGVLEHERVFLRPFDTERRRSTAYGKDELVVTDRVQL